MPTRPLTILQLLAVFPPCTDQAAMPELSIATSIRPEFGWIAMKH